MNWASLVDELDNWGRSGDCATFWWRDDDAVSDTDELDALLQCAGEVPVALAVIPKAVEASLARRLARHASVTVLQHGWRHANHASPGRRSSEYPAGRERDEVAREFFFGRHKLRQLFGAQALPVFAPPWHGFDDAYLPLLSDAGLIALSRKGPRTHGRRGGLDIANVHCVPLSWTTPPSFHGDEGVLRVLVDHLEGRRLGRYDASEPTGLLTHHLVQNARSYAFLRRLAETVGEHPAGRWLDAREVFALDAVAVPRHRNRAMARALAGSRQSLGVA